MNELNQISKWKGKNKDDYHLKIAKQNKLFTFRTINSLETIAQYSCNGHCIRREGEPTNWLCIDIDAKFDESFDELINLMKIKPAYILPSSSYSEELTYKLHCLFELKVGVFSKDFEKFYHEFVKSVLPEHIVYDKRLALYTQNMFGCNETFNSPLYIGEGYSFTRLIEDDTILESEETRYIPFSKKDFRILLNVSSYEGYHFTPAIRYKSKVTIGERRNWLYINILKGAGVCLTVNNLKGYEYFTLNNLIQHAIFLNSKFCISCASDNNAKIARDIKSTCSQVWAEVKTIDVKSPEFAIKCCADKTIDGKFKFKSKNKGLIIDKLQEFIEDNCLVEDSKLIISINDLLIDFNNSLKDNGLSICYTSLLYNLNKLHIVYSKSTNKVTIDEYDLQTLSTKELIEKYKVSISTIKRFKKGSSTTKRIISNTHTITHTVDPEPVKKQEIEWCSVKKLDTTNRDFKRKVKQPQEYAFNEC